MATVHFYEKPGCSSNSRQKALLLAAGQELQVHNLLTYPWQQQPEKLRAFFGALPVAQWFNPNAPAIKNGLLQPENLSAAAAMSLLLADPILIRRPLLAVAEHYVVGFVPEQLAPLLGLDIAQLAGAGQSCTQPQAKACQP